MNVIAKFEKVSLAQFKTDWLKFNPDATEAEITEIYNAIELPSRSTKGSAGYDIKSPVEFAINHGESKVIPTGLRCRIDDGWFLDINPRSGQGFKFGIRLANTRGIIDSDYYNADNEGHIMIKITNESVIAREMSFRVAPGQGFAQGIFTIYGITEDDCVDTERTGGLGSTDKK
ncbi:deoxyuridine 5'-triphosphate nucleotidohydrolase [bacterium]|nr:deoxyuridine 5'-triphosphate nucleotidohydrolase [bacterium]